uniref:Putative O-antigen transporter n=1 Tax=Escherichia coli TaxID=562 RepID=Q077Q8_ECOLX|nr:Wzx [Escherichia coli]
MKLMKDRFFYFFIELINKGVPFFLLPYVSSAVGVEVYGKIELFTTNYIILSFLFALGFEGWMNSHYFKISENNFITILSSFYFLSFLIFFISVITTLLYSSDWTALVIVGYIQSLLNITTLHLRLKGKYIRSGALLLAASIVNAVMVYVCFELFGKDYNARIEAFLFSSVLLVIFIILCNINIWGGGGKNKINFSFLNKDILLFCLPLCLTMVINWAKGNIDKYFIANLLDLKSLGIYAVAYQLASVINVVGIILNRTLQADLLKSMADGFYQTKKIILIFLSVLAIFFLLYVIAVCYGFNYVFSADYAPSRNMALLLIFCFLFFSTSSFLINFVLFYGRPKLILLQSLLITTIHVALSFLLIQKYALFGALFTQVITSILTFISTLLLCYILMKASHK